MLVVVLVVVLELAVGPELVRGHSGSHRIGFRKDNARVSYNQIFPGYTDLLAIS